MWIVTESGNAELRCEEAGALLGENEHRGQTVGMVSRNTTEQLRERDVSGVASDLP